MWVTYETHEKSITISFWYYKSVVLVNSTIQLYCYLNFGRYIYLSNQKKWWLWTFFSLYFKFWSCFLSLFNLANIAYLGRTCYICIFHQMELFSWSEWNACTWLWSCTSYQQDALFLGILQQIQQGHLNYSPKLSKHAQHYSIFTHGLKKRFKLN